MLDVAKEQQIDFLLLAGDIFEGAYMTRHELADISYRFAKLINCDIILIAGNHDPLALAKIYQNTNWPDNVHIAASAFTRFEFKAKGVVVQAISFASAEQLPLDFTKVPPVDAALKNVLLLHGNVYTDDGHCYIDRAKLTVLSYDYIALGHIHKHDFIAPHIAYCGSLEPLDFGEQGEHGYILGNLTTATYQFIPFSKRSFIEVDIEVTEADVISTIVDKIASACAGLSDDFIRIVLTGYKQSGLTLKKSDLVALLDVYYFEIVDRCRASISIEQLLSAAEGSFITEFANSFSEEELSDETYRSAYQLGINMLYEEQIEK